MSELLDISRLESLSFSESMCAIGICLCFMAVMSALFFKRRTKMQRQDFLESLIDTKRAELLSVYLRYPERARSGLLRGDSWANMLASYMVNHARFINEQYRPYGVKRPAVQYAKARLSKARNRRGILLFLCMDDVPRLHALIKQENQNILRKNDNLLNDKSRKDRHWGSGLFIRKLGRRPSCDGR